MQPSGAAHTRPGVHVGALRELARVVLARLPYVVLALQASGRALLPRSVPEHPPARPWQALPPPAHVKRD